MIKEVLLSSICDLKNGFAFKSKDYVDSSNTLSCRMSSIRPGGNFDLEHNQRFLPDTYAELYSDYLLNDGDIVIAMTDLAGDPKILGVPTIVNTGGKKLLQNQRVGKLVITDSSKVFIPYLQYALNRPSNKSYYKKFASGGLQINVSKKDILNNSVPLPPLDQQKKIAAILDAADTYRQKTKALITKYDALTQSLFLDMFGDPVKNPKGWDRMTLNKCYISKKEGTKCGPFGSALKKHEYVDNGIPVWTMYNIKHDGFDRNKCLFITAEKYNDLASYETKLGDIIISRAGTVGKMCVVKYDGEAIISTNLIRLRLDSNKMLPLYFTLLMNKWGVRVARLKTGAEGAFTHMNTGILNNINLPIPPINLQNQFAERVQAIETQKAQAEASLVHAENLFHSLLQRAFKGELV